MQFTRPRGTRDFLPEEMARRREVENAMREMFERYGYAEIQTPTFENLELITKKSGEEIRQRLYHFKDKSGRDIALRPELTAPALRLYVNELQFSPKPVKIYYFENCFRYEEPQAGRYREFWQAGVELIGSSNPEAEAEVILLAVDTLKAVGLKKFDVQIGHLGILRGLLQECGVSEERQNELMGIIDKGDEEGLIKALERLDIPEKDKKILLKILELVGDKEEVLNEARGMLKGKNIAVEGIEKLKGILKALESFGIGEYRINLGIARGLDYYTGMVFEIYAPNLGAQSQICGGGSYSLVETLGGKATPSCGFAFGFDRVLLALEKQGYSFGAGKRAGVLVVPTGEKLLDKALMVSSTLRKHVPCEVDLMRRKLGKALSYADSKGLQFVVIVGEDEMKEHKVLLRDMDTGEQKKLSIEEVVECIKI